MILFKIIVNTLSFLIRVWCLLFCIISMGYFLDGYILNNNTTVRLTFEYFLYLFTQGFMLCGSIFGIVLIVRAIRLWYNDSRDVR